MSEFNTIGRPTKLHDGHDKVTGATRYTTDLVLPGMLHARFVMSPYAHADIRGIDKSEALAVAGVYAVLTADDLPDVPARNREWLLLARGRVIFMGQPVALVLAESETAAEDGMERVLVDYEPLPVAMDMDSALAEGAPLVWPRGIPGHDHDKPPTNRIVTDTSKHGDIQRGFAEADVIVERTFTSPIVHQSYVEPHATLAQPDPSGGITVWSSTQAMFDVQGAIVEMLNLSESRVRVISPPVGGGFGGKFILYEPLVAAAAMAVNRPVKLVLTRMEEMAAANPAPKIRVHAKLGAKRDGALTAFETEIFLDAGCYPMYWLGGFTGFQMRYYYNIPHYMLRSSEIVTFKPSVASYRAPGGPTASLTIETLMDELAVALKMDPIDLRLRNIVATGQAGNDGKLWQTIGGRDVLDAVRHHPLWQNREAIRARGRGVGVAIGGWPGAYEPSSAICMLNRNGRVQLQMASVDLNGTGTGFQILAAEILNIAPDQIDIVYGDTLTAPYAAQTGGSQVTYSTGVAVLSAAREVRHQILVIASEQLEAAVEDLEINDGKIQVKGFPSKSLTFSDIAEKTRGMNSPKHPPVVSQGRSAQPINAPVFSAQLAEVSIDYETGQVQVHRLVVFQDVGRAINPLAIQGQIHGGAVQGIGWALYEQILYDESGQLMTGSWMDYAVPASTQAAPEIEVVLIEVPSDHGPFGARGVGEAPVVATSAAIANAIADVTGLRLSDLPMTAPRVLEKLSAG